MQKIGLKIVFNDAVAFLANADGRWNKQSVDYDAALRSLRNAGNGDGIYMLSYLSDATLVGMVSVIDANEAVMVMCIPATVKISSEQLLSLISTVKTSLHMGQIDTVKLAQVMARDYPTRDTARQYVPSQGQQLACHYYGHDDTDLTDLLAGSTYEAYFSHYKLILLIDNTLPVTPAAGCAELSTVVPAAVEAPEDANDKAADAADDDEPLPPPFDPNFDYYAAYPEKPLTQGGFIEHPAPAAPQQQASPQRQATQSAALQQPAQPQQQQSYYVPEQQSHSDSDSRRVTRGVLIGVLCLAIVGGGVYGLGRHFGWFGQQGPIAEPVAEEETSIAPVNEVTQPSTDELLVNALNAGTWYRDDFEAAGYGYLWDEINNFEFETLLHENLPDEAAASKGWRRLIDAIERRASSDLNDFDEGQTFSHGSSIRVRSYLNYITTEPKPQEEMSVETDTIDVIHSAPEQDQESKSASQPDNKQQQRHQQQNQQQSQRHQQLQHGNNPVVEPGSE